MTRVLWQRTFRRFRVRLEWKPADLWVGAYRRQERMFADRWQHDVWVCLVPCVPVHVTWWKGLP